MIPVPADAISINRRELKLRLGEEPTGEVQTLVLRYTDIFRRQTHPVYCFRECGVTVDDGICSFDFGRVHSRDLCKYLDGAWRVYIFAATLGIGADRAICAADCIGVLNQYVADAVASAMIESLCDDAQAMLPLPTRSRFSPGYGDLSVEIQPALLSYLNAERELGLHLTDSCLMTPTKSVTAIIRIKDEP